MTLVRTSDAQWRLLFDLADVVSEGSARGESSGPMWYGSTSLILPTGGCDAKLLTALAENDVHLRVRALRTACREAALRAPCPLGRLVCEIRVSSVAEGVRIDVDVQAPLIGMRAAVGRRK